VWRAARIVRPDRVGRRTTPVKCVVRSDYSPQTPLRPPINLAALASSMTARR